jgi:hypothetical protein
MQIEPAEARVLVLPPTKTDGSVTMRLLEEAGVHAGVCDSAEEMARELCRGAGALIITDDSTRHDALTELRHVLERQPSWSEIPILVLARPDSPRLDELRNFPGVVLLERPQPGGRRAPGVLVDGHGVPAAREPDQLTDAHDARALELGPGDDLPPAGDRGLGGRRGFLRRDAQWQRACRQDGERGGGQSRKSRSHAGVLKVRATPAVRFRWRIRGSVRTTR